MLFKTEKEEAEHWDKTDLSAVLEHGESMTEEKIVKCEGGKECDAYVCEHKQEHPYNEVKCESRCYYLKKGKCTPVDSSVTEKTAG